MWWAQTLCNVNIFCHRLAHFYPISNFDIARALTEESLVLFIIWAIFDKYSGFYRKMHFPKIELQIPMLNKDILKIKDFRKQFQFFWLLYAINLKYYLLQFQQNTLSFVKVLMLTFNICKNFQRNLNIFPLDIFFAEGFLYRCSFLATHFG